VPHCVLPQLVRLCRGHQPGHLVRIWASPRVPSLLLWPT